MFVLRWVWPVAATAGLIAVIGALMILVASLARTETGPAASIPAWMSLWHRFEEGNLTREEFGRERGKRPAAPSGMRSV